MRMKKENDIKENNDKGDNGFWVGFSVSAVVTGTIAALLLIVFFW